MPRGMHQPWPHNPNQSASRIPGAVHMMACAEICQTSANMMLIGTHHHKHTCRECAEICEECAANCDAVGGMEACAEQCRKCAASCRAMAA